MTYPKFKSKDKCAFPEREDCNGDTPSCNIRCKFMKYNNSKSILDPTRWECTYNKEAQNKDITPNSKTKLNITEGNKD